MQVFEEKHEKLYAGSYAQKLGEINANRNVIVLLLLINWNTSNVSR